MKKTCIMLLLAACVFINSSYTLRGTVSQSAVGSFQNFASLQKALVPTMLFTMPETYYCGYYYCGPSGEGGFPPYTTFLVYSDLNNHSQITWIAWGSIEHELTGFDYGSFNPSTGYASFAIYTESGTYEFSGYLNN